uniref:Uncharacterized protein n=1 Tax=Timema cristinae TaxID=61476 RepID=A0A7R9CTQ6_TIMCR|nr:unnamed protein product [Timema cristinae]
MLPLDQQAIAQKLFSDVLFLGKLGQLTTTASVLPTSPASLPMPVCGPSPTVPYYHSRYSQPFERFNHQYDRFSSVSDLASPPMSNHGSTSSQTTPSPSPRIAAQVSGIMVDINDGDIAALYFKSLYILPVAKKRCAFSRQSGSFVPAVDQVGVKRLHAEIEGQSPEPSEDGDEDQDEEKKARMEGDQ